jgi:hypothetical protein
MGAGWWDVEYHGPAAMRRWTDGTAVLPLTASGPIVVEVDLAGTLDYPLPIPEQRVASGRRVA